jgi:hypothetical protein
MSGVSPSERREIAAGRSTIARSGQCKPASAGCVDWLRLAAGTALLVVGSTIFAVPGTAVSATGSDAGVWVVVGTGEALEIFDCAGLLCGRIVWPRKARNTAGRPVQDDENPDPTFRRRPPCGLTILHGLRPAGRDHWNSGSLYNLEDGQTYRVSAKPRSPDVLVVRISVDVPLFGETKDLAVDHGD